MKCLEFSMEIGSVLCSTFKMCWFCKTDRGYHFLRSLISESLHFCNARFCCWMNVYRAASKVSRYCAGHTTRATSFSLQLFNSVFAWCIWGALRYCHHSPSTSVFEPCFLGIYGLVVCKCIRRVYKKGNLQGNQCYTPTRNGENHMLMN
jgi:hypothetical protein